MSYEPGLDARTGGSPDRRRRHGFKKSTNGTSMSMTPDIPGDRLTPGNCTVLLIDHQVGPLWELEATPTRRSVTEFARVAKLARIPTIITSHSSDANGGIISELIDHQPTARYISRSAPNPWDDLRVQRAVRATGRGTLLLSGTAADVSVASCALSAISAGFLVCILIDASAGFSQRAIRRLSMAGVIVTTTVLVIAELMQ